MKFPEPVERGGIDDRYMAEQDDGVLVIEDDEGSAESWIASTLWAQIGGVE